MIVSDASTLILLARVSILRRFLSAFGKIIVPEEVAKEMTVSPNFDARMLEREIKENNIAVKSIKSSTGEITDNLDWTREKQKCTSFTTNCRRG